MKKLIVKYWPALYATLVAVYESYSFISDSEFIPKWVKVALLMLAFFGYVAKNYKPKDNEN